MGPLAGVIVCDYYGIKQRKLNVHELYKDRGIYWWVFVPQRQLVSVLTCELRYDAGFNWRAFVAFVIGFAPLIPGFAKSINNDLNVGGAWKIYTFAWIFGFVFSSLSYLVICKYISPQTTSLVTQAVYPPSRARGDTPGHESPSVLEGVVTEEEVKDAAIKEKEIV